RQKAEDRLKEVTREYKTMIHNIKDGVFLVNIDNGKYIFRRLNPAFARSLGVFPDELVGKGLCEIYSDKECQKLLHHFDRCRLEKRTVNYEDKVEKDSNTIYWHTKLSPIMSGDRVVQIVGVSRDITRHKKNEEKIKHLTFHDSLTGLYNRAYFQQELKRYNTPRQLPLSLIIGDVNGLKLANDAFGHGKGDKLLVKIANIIKNCCRQEDLVARWGGDEFVILLPQTDKKAASKIKERIKNSVQSLSGDPVKPSIALGVAAKNDKNEDIKEVFQRAEKWMYKNKLQESRDIHGKIISSLKKSFFEKTHETDEHCHRLHVLSKKLGRKLGLNDQQLTNLGLLAELHDLGKVGVNEDILKKEETLSEKEKRELQRHPEIGYQIASSSPHLNSVAEDILAHHEHWDGSGYPRELKGKEIPLLARIIAVVDTYDVLTNGRPKCPSCGHREAVDKLRENAGKKYDPDIVEVFITEVLNKEKNIAN
ncbi:MAG: diguanylate cyclase domain-containing protein, partial [Halanaerobiales bacterium]